MFDGASSYRRFLHGDEGAFDEIMNELFDGLVFFINRYVHDLHTAEDIAIDVFTELIVHPNRYNFKVELKTYLYMLGRSRALNYIKHRKIITFTELSNVEHMASDEFDYEDILLADERKRILKNAIDTLPENQRTAVYLVYLEEMSYDDAGKIMKKTRKQIDNLLYRAKKELRNTLRNEVELLL